MNRIIIRGGVLKEIDSIMYKSSEKKWKGFPSFQCKNLLKLLNLEMKKFDYLQFFISLIAISPPPFSPLNPFNFGFRLLRFLIYGFYSFQLGELKTEKFGLVVSF